MQIRQASPGDYRRLAELHVLARYDMAYLPHVHSFTLVEKWMRETVLPRQHVCNRLEMVISSDMLHFTMAF
jgi:hypothetical protein